jgi:hypothetical protein
MVKFSRHINLQGFPQNLFCIFLRVLQFFMEFGSLHEFLRIFKWILEFKIEKMIKSHSFETCPRPCHTGTPQRQFKLRVARPHSATRVLPQWSPCTRGTWWRWARGFGIAPMVSWETVDHGVPARQGGGGRSSPWRGATVRWWFHYEAAMFIDGRGATVVSGGSNLHLQHQGCGEDARREGIEERLTEDGAHRRIAVAAQCVGGGVGVLLGRAKVLARSSLRVLVGWGRWWREWSPLSSRWQQWRTGKELLLARLVGVWGLSFDGPWHGDQVAVVAVAQWRGIRGQRHGQSSATLAIVI